MNQIPKRRLGRGLAALIGDDSADETMISAPEIKSALRMLPIDAIVANPLNPRKVFAAEDLDNLARSIRDKGILQPLVVRSSKTDGLYEIVAGERRWRAAQLAQHHTVPALIRDLDDRETIEIALIENIQRSDLNPLEEAQGYKQLIDHYQYTQQQLAEGLGKSRSHIANTLRLLNLPAAVRAKIESGILSAGHARALIATDDPSALADEIVKLGMSVRQTETLVRDAGTSHARTAASKDADTRAFEKQLSAAIGMKAEIKTKGEGGVLSIRYVSLDQLDHLFRKLAG